jgi:hypothetical protein
MALEANTAWKKIQVRFCARLCARFIPTGGITTRLPGVIQRILIVIDNFWQTHREFDTLSNFFYDA